MPAWDWFTVALSLLLLIVAPIALGFIKDEPRDDDPPDTGGEDGRRSLAGMPQPA